VLLCGQVVAVGKAALFGVEDPLAHLVAVEVEPGSVVLRIPLFLRVIGVAQEPGVGGADVLRSDVGLLYFFVEARVAGEPVISVERDAEGELIFLHRLQGVVEIFIGPDPAADGAGRRPVGVLVVCHEAEQIDGLAEGFEVKDTTPVGEDPFAEWRVAGVAGGIGDDRDLKLKMLLVKGVGDSFDRGGERVTIGPTDVLEVELEAVVAIFLQAAMSEAIIADWAASVVSSVCIFTLSKSATMGKRAMWRCLVTRVTLGSGSP
jgi:hypothetical protein